MRMPLHDVKAVALWPNRDPIGERGGINLYLALANRPVSAIDRFGLFITFHGNNEPEFNDLWEKCLCTLSSSPRGNELVEMAIRSQREIRFVQVDENWLGVPENNLEWGVGVLRDFDGKIIGAQLGLAFNHWGVGAGHPIFQVKDYLEELPPLDDPWSACAVVLGHELGHALYGSRIEGQDPPDGINVQVNENPIRAFFGLPVRRTYHGTVIEGPVIRKP